MRGLVHYRLGQWKLSMDTMQRAHELNTVKKLPQSAEDLTILAIALHNTRKLDQSLSTLEQVRTAASYNEATFQKLLKEAEHLLNLPKASAHPERWIGKRFMPRVNPIV